MGPWWKRGCGFKGCRDCGFGWRMKCLAEYRQLSQAAIFLEGEPSDYMLATYLHSCWIAIRC